MLSDLANQTWSTLSLYRNLNGEFQHPQNFLQLLPCRSPPQAEPNRAHSFSRWYPHGGQHRGKGYRTGVAGRSCRCGNPCKHREYLRAAYGLSEAAVQGDWNGVRPFTAAPSFHFASEAVSVRDSLRPCRYMPAYASVLSRVDNLSSVSE